MFASWSIVKAMRRRVNRRAPCNYTHGGGFAKTDDVRTSPKMKTYFRRNAFAATAAAGVKFKAETRLRCTRAAWSESSNAPKSAFYDFHSFLLVVCTNTRVVTETNTHYKWFVAHENCVLLLFWRTSYVDISKSVWKKNQTTKKQFYVFIFSYISW